MNNGLEHWLRARTVGLCMTYNRLMEFRVVRSTRCVVWTPARMVEDSEHSMRRTPEHVARHEHYPDPMFYLNYQGKYLFRNHALRHLRPEQFNRYPGHSIGSLHASHRISDVQLIRSYEEVSGRPLRRPFA